MKVANQLLTAVEQLPDDLRRLYEQVSAAAADNPEFAAVLAMQFGSAGLVEKSEEAATVRRRARHRRAPGPFDPFVVMGEGEGALRQRLEALDLEQLKDIVAEHAMDSTKLAAKWRTPERLVALIVDTVRSRSSKGAVFRRPGQS